MVSALAVHQSANFILLLDTDLEKLHKMMEDPVKRPPVFDELRPKMTLNHGSIPRPTPDTFLDAGVIVRGTLTAGECRAIIELSESKGYQDAEDYCMMYRDRWNDRFMSDDAQLAEFMWDRVKEYIPSRVRGKNREWAVESLNTRFRFCKYIGGQGHYFGPHTDGMYIVDNNRRSLLTCMWYLNGPDEFEGGRTNFITYPDKKLKYSVVPEPGLCVIFPQEDLKFYHEGTQVTKGLKYILRTDVMYNAIN